MLYTNDAIKKRKQKEITIKATIRIIVFLVVFPLLIYNITLIIQSVANPKKTPSFFGIKTYVIISGSMMPKLQIGDIVIVKEADSSNLKQGDIISFREGQNIITHRIIEAQNDNGQILYKTKGDNNNSEDEQMVSLALIEGKVIKRIPYVGKIALFFKGKIAIILIFIIYYIIISKERKNKLRKSRRRNKRVLYEEKIVENGRNELINERKNDNK